MNKEEEDRKKRKRIYDKEYRKKNLEKIKAYQKKYRIENGEKVRISKRLRKKKNRSNYLLEKSCKQCGSKENLQVHHVDPDKKTTHKFWGWGEKRRIEELKKCIVLCRRCHIEVHVEMGTFKGHTAGEKSGHSKLKNDDVLKIVKRLEKGEAYSSIAENYDVNFSAIGDIARGQTWTSITNFSRRHKREKK